MLRDNHKRCVINAGIGLWYCKGAERLKGALVGSGWPAKDILSYQHWPNDKFDKSCVYNVKAACFYEAIHAGYTTILWADASMWNQKPIDPLIEEIERDGYFLGTSGYGAAQTTTDAQLAYFGVTRDQAAQWPDSATGLFGVDLQNPVAKKFIDEWMEAAVNGAFGGSRLHAGQSEDPRFAFGRQDQAAASIIAGKNGMKLGDIGRFVSFAWDPPTKMFLSRGM